MHILLINNNPIVSQLISLGVNETQIYLEEVTEINLASKENYDVVFIDEGSYSDELLEHLNTLIETTKIFLSTGKTFNDEHNLFHIVVKKPFLPTYITDILEKESQKEKYLSSVELDTPSIFPLATEEEQIDSVEKEEQLPSVLNTVEIDQIKILLELDNQELSEVLTVNNDDYKDQKEKKKKRKLIFEEKLLKAVTKMKKKKIKKLINLADVTIKIKFKDK